MSELTPRIIKRFDEVQADLKKATEIVAEGGTAILSSLLTTAVIGSPEQAVLLAAPGAMNMVMNYLRMRRENNIIHVLNAIQEKMIVLADVLQNIPREAVPEFRDRIFPLVFEYAEDELEQEKIKLFVNGFESTVEQQVIDQSRILFLYDILKSLRMIEIKFLLGIPEKTMKLYKGMHSEKLREHRKYTEWRDQFPASPFHKQGIIQKLKRLDLVSELDSYVPELFEPAHRIDQLQLSPFGKEFVEFFKMQGGEEVTENESHHSQ